MSKRKILAVLMAFSVNGFGQPSGISTGGASAGAPDVQKGDVGTAAGANVFGNPKAPAPGTVFHPQPNPTSAQGSLNTQDSDREPAQRGKNSEQENQEPY